MDSRASSPLAFRKDIEGLRAVAIILVVAAYTGLPGLAGGFIGVDVFFVLSGYLITRILAHDAAPSLIQFYAGRMRRLLPALALMLLVTSIASVVLLAPTEQVPQAALARAVVLWLGNFWLDGRGLDYFSPAPDTLIHQHAWSLAVEEQFYLIWPLVVAAVIGPARSASITPSVPSSPETALALKYL